MLKVWGRNTSVNVQKVLWSLEELNLEFEREDVGGAFGGLDTAEFGRLNPNRKIPVLQDGDFSLWESGAIVRYIAETYGEGSLSPSGIRERALATQWCGWCQSSLYVDFIGNTFQPLIRVTAAERDVQSLEAAADRVGKTLTILDRALEGHDFVVGDSLTFADIELGALMHRYFTLPISRPDLPNVRAWYDRLATRPAYQANIMQDWTKMKIPGA